MRYSIVMVPTALNKVAYTLTERLLWVVTERYRALRLGTRARP